MRLTLLSDALGLVREQERARLRGAFDDGWARSGAFVALERGNSQAQSKAVGLVRANSLLGGGWAP